MSACFTLDRHGYKLGVGIVIRLRAQLYCLESRDLARDHGELQYGCHHVLRLRCFPGFFCQLFFSKNRIIYDGPRSMFVFNSSLIYFLYIRTYLGHAASGLSNCCSIFGLFTLSSVLVYYTSSSAFFLFWLDHRCDSVTRSPLITCFSFQHAACSKLDTTQSMLCYFFSRSLIHIRVHDVLSSVSNTIGLDRQTDIR